MLLSPPLSPSLWVQCAQGYHPPGIPATLLAASPSSLTSIEQSDRRPLPGSAVWGPLWHPSAPLRTWVVRKLPPCLQVPLPFPSSVRADGPGGHPLRCPLNEVAFHAARSFPMLF